MGHPPPHGPECKTLVYIGLLGRILFRSALSNDILLLKTKAMLMWLVISF